MHRERVLDLVVGDREVAVPEEGQLLEQWAAGAHHPVQPPGLDVLDVLEVEQVALEAVEQAVELLADPLGMEQLLERRLEPKL